MRVLFLQNFWQPYLGVCSIAAVLKSRGHNGSVIIAEEPENALLEQVELEKPDVVGFSCMTSSVRWALSTAKIIKDSFPTIKTILGGIHPTVCPDVIEHDNVDMVCRGEGEFALAELMDALAKGTDYSNIKNLWVKTGDGITRNELRPLISDLDQLPFPDRSIYYERYPFLRDMVSKSIMVGRGCPFPCAFCVNHSLIRLYKGKGPYVRRRSPENILKEINELRSIYRLEHIYFNDDTFTLKYDWLADFLGVYRRTVGLPFTCGTRADLVTPKLVKLLKESGCYCAEMGIENGNEAFRKQRLKKNITNAQILEAARLIKKAGIYLKTSNMTGVPGETVDMAFQTIELNRKCNVDFMNCSLLQPYPGLEITDYAQQEGFLPLEFDFLSLEGMSYRKNPIRAADIQQMQNLQRFFLLCVKFPWTEPIVRELIRLPANFLFDLVFKATYVQNYKKYHGLPLWQVVKLAFRARRHY
jgi:anaerobic magnesium-protoporphyrin IX monomethyl ester cyclase